VAGFKVDPPAMEAFAGTCDARAAAFDEVRTNMEAAHVPRESFGRIPGIGERISRAYEQHVQACTEGIASATEAMTAVAGGVRAVAANYHGVDSASRDGLAALHRQIDDVAIRGVR
jgi:hypothetical protein